VSDGYCNARAAKFTPTGKHVMDFSLAAARAAAEAKGEGGEEDVPERDILVAHSVAVDECDGKLFLADREGKRVFTFGLKDSSLLGARAPRGAGAGGAGCVARLRPGGG
jgi:hypothetical protein